MAGLFEHKKRQLEEHITQAVQGTPIDETVVEDELFVEAVYDASAAERGGYSNYSYWRSTLNAFLHNRMAVAMLIVLALLLAGQPVFHVLLGEGVGIGIHDLRVQQHLLQVGDIPLCHLPQQKPPGAQNLFHGTPPKKEGFSLPNGTEKPVVPPNFTPGAGQGSFASR